MTPDDAWKNTVRTALRDDEPFDAVRAHVVGAVAVTRGTRHLNARASARAAAVGAVVASAVTLGVYGWAEAEAASAAATTLTHGAPWIP
jgi:hypothetical protein